MFSPEPAPEAPVAPKVKRRLFKNQPEWGVPRSSVESSFTGHSPPFTGDKKTETNANISSGGGGNEAENESQQINLFSRSEDTLASFEFANVHANKRSAKPRKAEADVELVKVPKSPGGKVKAETEREKGREPKRRRTEESDADSVDSHYEELYGSGSPRDVQRSSSKHKSSPTHHSKIKPSPGKTGPRPTKDKSKIPASAVVIELDEDSGQEADASAPPSPTPVSRALPENQQEPISLLESPPQTPPQTKDATPPPSHPTPSKSITPPPPLSPDAILTLFIHSELPDTSPLVVKIESSKRLYEVRRAWCRRQGFTDEQMQSVFLTWHDMRIYDFTTAKSLGIHVNDVGDVYYRGKYQELGTMDSHLMMEVENKEISERKAQEKKMRAQRPQSRGDAAASGEGPGQAEAGEEELNVARIVLRAKEYEELRVTIKKTTTFAKIAAVFRNQRQVPADKQISLMFEGDVLPPAAEAQESDIGDRDYVDVYIK